MKFSRQGADTALTEWLKARYDKMMWWKEFLHHEGVSKRTNAAISQKFE